MNANKLIRMSIVPGHPTANCAGTFQGTSKRVSGGPPRGEPRHRAPSPGSGARREASDGVARRRSVLRPLASIERETDYDEARSIVGRAKRVAIASEANGAYPAGSKPRR